MSSLPLGFSPSFSFYKLLQRIQVLVERDEGLESSAGVDGRGSDHCGQNLHVDDGAIKQRTEKRHLFTHAQNY